MKGAFWKVIAVCGLLLLAVAVFSNIYSRNAENVPPATATTLTGAAMSPEDNSEACLQRVAELARAEFPDYTIYSEGDNVFGFELAPDGSGKVAFYCDTGSGRPASVNVTWSGWPDNLEITSREVVGDQ